MDSRSKPSVSLHGRQSKLIAKLERADNRLLWGAEFFEEAEVALDLRWAWERYLFIRAAKGCTTSALSLVEAKLPEWRVALNSDSHRGPPWAAAVKPHGASWPAPAAMSMSWSPALAILIALVKALASVTSAEGVAARQLREEN